MAHEPAMSAGRVLDVLQAKMFKPGPHIMLREVGNSTGFGKNRSADGFVVSCWPSRGIWFAGIEVKCYRGDWLRELAQPEKSHAVQRFCHYWWIATPAGIVQSSEVPETWGLVEIAGKSSKIIKQAPRLTPDELAPEFVAAVVRQFGQMTEGGRLAEYTRGKLEAIAELEKEPEPAVEDLKDRLAHQTRVAESAECQFKDLRDRVAEFQRQTGVDLNTYFGSRHAVDEFKALKRIDHYDIVRMAEVYREVAAALESAHGKITAAQGAASEAAQ